MARIVEKIHHNPYRSDIRGTDEELIREWRDSERAQFLIHHGEYVRHERIKCISEYGYEHVLYIAFDIPSNLETLYYLKFGKENGSSS
jgi:predicted phosphodiesterase